MNPRGASPDLCLSAGRQGGSGLSTVLSAHCLSSDVAYAALLEESGAVFAESGDESLRDHGETAALAVGAYHAVQEVARRLGEPVFEGLCHEGSQRHFYISPVDSRFMLLSVFGNDTRLAIVRASASRTAVNLRDCLAAGAAPEMSGLRNSNEGDLVVSGDYFLAMQ